MWHHQLMVFIPDNLDNSTHLGAIYNTNGDNPLPAKPPGLSDPEVMLISKVRFMVGNRRYCCSLWFHLVSARCQHQVCDFHHLANSEPARRVRRRPQAFAP